MELKRFLLNYHNTEMEAAFEKKGKEESKTIYETANKTLVSVKSRLVKVHEVRSLLRSEYFKFLTLQNSAKNWCSLFVLVTCLELPVSEEMKDFERKTKTQQLTEKRISKELKMLKNSLSGSFLFDKYNNHEPFSEKDNNCSICEFLHSKNWENEFEKFIRIESLCHILWYEHDDILNKEFPSRHLTNQKTFFEHLIDDYYDDLPSIYEKVTRRFYQVFSVYPLGTELEKRINERAQEIRKKENGNRFEMIQGLFFGRILREYEEKRRKKLKVVKPVNVEEEMERYRSLFESSKKDLDEEIANEPEKFHSVLISARFGEDDEELVILEYEKHDSECEFDGEKMELERAQWAEDRVKIANILEDMKNESLQFSKKLIKENDELKNERELGKKKLEHKIVRLEEYEKRFHLFHRNQKVLEEVLKSKEKKEEELIRYSDERLYMQEKRYVKKVREVEAANRRLFEDLVKLEKENTSKTKHIESLSSSHSKEVEHISEFLKNMKKEKLSVIQQLEEEKNQLLKMLQNEHRSSQRLSLENGQLRERVANFRQRLEVSERLGLEKRNRIEELRTRLEENSQEVIALRTICQHKNVGGK